MDQKFEGKKILVTGAGRGIGRGIAISLAKSGAKVYALSKTKENLEALVKEVPDIVSVQQDLNNWEETREAVENLGDIDGLVNCAAVLPPHEGALDVSKDSVDLVLDVNLKAAINIMQIVGKKMVAAGNGGSIVNISSVGGDVAIAGLMPYCVAKAGLNMATKAFALELGPQKIRINSLSLAVVNTEMIQLYPKEVIKHSVSKIPTGRMIEIEEVVDCVAFLLSDKTKQITGSTITMDGGHTCYVPN